MDRPPILNCGIHTSLQLLSAAVTSQGRRRRLPDDGTDRARQAVATVTVTQRLVIKARCSKLKSRRDPGIGEMQSRNPGIEKYPPGLYTLTIAQSEKL